MVLVVSNGVIILIVFAAFIGSILLFLGIAQFDIALSKEWNKPFKLTRKQVKVTETIGKLVRKVKDDNSDQKALVMRRNYARMNMDNNPNLTRYYLTFETHKGYKSFTVPYDVFKKYKKNTYGIIRHQKSHFVSFQYRTKESLGLVKQNDD